MAFPGITRNFEASMKERIAVSSFSRNLLTDIPEIEESELVVEKIDSSDIRYSKSAEVSAISSSCLLIR